MSSEGSLFEQDIVESSMHEIFSGFLQQI